MAFITTYKMNSILQRIDGAGIHDPIKDLLKKTYFFLDDKEIDELSVYYLFLSDPIAFIEKNYLKWKDTKQFIFENKPAYHSNQQCEYMRSKFDNVKIPSIIKTHKLTDELRRWGINHRSLYNTSKDDFIKLCVEYFHGEPFHLNLSEKDFEKVDLINSGAVDFLNYTIDELRTLLKKIVHDAKKFFATSFESQILKDYRNKRWLYKPEYDIYGDNEGVIQSTLEIIETKFCRPVIALSKEYFRKQFNSEGQFNVTVLDILNFKPCGGCH